VGRLSRMNYTNLAIKADALCLGPHWIYDQDQLTQAYPTGVHAPSDPLSPYHPNRKAGHYDIGHWKKTWLTEMTNYDGYIDGACKTVLSSGAETPSGSNEFAVVARIAPILDLGLSVDEAVVQAQSQAHLTHAGDQIPEVIEFFVRVIYRIKDGVSAKDALTSESDSASYPKLSPATSLKAAELADAENFRAVANKFGQACSLESAFPLTMYFALHHGTDAAQCLSKNALAGGDNTARAMVLSMLLA